MDNNGNLFHFENSNWFCSKLHIRFSYPDSWKGGTSLCASGNDVVVCNSSDNQVVVVVNRNRAIGTVYKLAEHEGGYIRSICSAPDDSFLTLDGNKGIVRCYKLYEKTTPTLGWMCSDISKGYSICSDNQGLVNVNDEGKLHIMFEGRLYTMYLN